MLTAGDQRARYGDRVSTVVIDDASHALFSERRPGAVTIEYLRR